MKNTTHTHYEIRSSIITLILKIVWVQTVMTLLHIFLSNIVIWHGIHDTTFGLFSWKTRELFVFHTIVTIITVYLIMNRLTTYYSLHSSELVCERWIISKNKYITKLDQNTDLTYQQSWFQRIFGYWDIILKNQFSDNKTILKNIPNTQYYVELIKNQCFSSEKKQNIVLKER